MADQELPDEVQALLRARIESYEELHTLLLLFAERREWSREEISARLKLPEAATDSSLAALERDQLISSAGEAGSERRYRYAPNPLDSAVGLLARAYQEQPIAVIRCMATVSIERIRAEALRAFSDAFLFRKGR